MSFNSAVWRTGHREPWHDNQQKACCCECDWSENAFHNSVLLLRVSRVIPIYPLSPTLVVKLSSAELLSALFPIRRRELAETALSSPDAAPLCARPCSSVPVSCRQSELMSAHSHLSAEYWQWWYSLCQPRLLPRGLCSRLANQIHLFVGSAISFSRVSWLFAPLVSCSS